MLGSPFYHPSYKPKMKTFGKPTPKPPREEPHKLEPKPLQMKEFDLEMEGKRATKHLDEKLDGERQTIDHDWEVL